MTVAEEKKLRWLTLSLIPTVGIRSLWRLYNAFGSVEGILNASETSMVERGGVQRRTAQAIVRRETTRNPKAEWERLGEENISFITWDDAEYPPLLRHIHLPPLFLFARGTYRCDHVLAIALVGTRRPSVRGVLFAERLASDLTSHGITVVSGLALGIDTAAHRGSVRVHPERSIAVVGSGLDVPYPKANRELLGEIARSGVVFSEYPLGTPPERWRFPLRNRIVSGLSMGVVVVEAGIKSGALITARCALEQGREVFAVPGPVNDPRSAGVHHLLKEGATLIENVHDILGAYDHLAILQGRAHDVPKEQPGERACLPPSAPSHCSHRTSPPEEAQRVLAALTDTPQHIDVLCQKTALPCGRLLSLLTMLEINGMVRQLPGKHFLRERGKGG